MKEKYIPTFVVLSEILLNPVVLENPPLLKGKTYTSSLNKGRPGWIY